VPVIVVDPHRVSEFLTHSDDDTVGEARVLVLDDVVDVLLGRWADHVLLENLGYRLVPELVLVAVLKVAALGLVRLEDEDPAYHHVPRWDEGHCVPPIATNIPAVVLDVPESLEDADAAANLHRDL
jgi:hypothetical protein